jgi:hypothetical protein
MPDFDEWDKNEQGLLKVWPKLGFSTVMFPNQRGGLRLEVGAPPAKPEDPVAAVQVSFREEQLRALAQALTEVAERLVADRRGSGHA